MMEQVYRNFYRSFYARTGGFMPSAPFEQSVFPGDFFQVKDGSLLLLGNIFRNKLVDAQDARFGYALKLNPAGWDFSDGVSKPYSGRGIGQGPIEGQFEFSRQELAFSKKGSFFFRAKNPESVKILNWAELQQQLIIRLTQTHFSFRDLYVATECATASDWTLAVAGSEKGYLEIATDAENFGLVDIFGLDSAKTIHSKDLEFYHRESRRRPVFFKAKKLAVQNEKHDMLISELVGQWNEQQDWASTFYDYDFHYETPYTRQGDHAVQASVLDLLQSGQLNPGTALQYFRWADVSLDDLEKLFVSYGCRD